MKSFAVLGSCVIVLAACLGPEDEPAAPSPAPSATPATIASPTQSVLPSATPTSTTSPAPTESVSPTAAPPLPTPVLPTTNDNIFQLSTIVFEETSPDCQLPCWNDLRIGESGLADVQTAFNSAFAFPDSADGFWVQRFDDPSLTGLALHDTVDRFGAYAVGYNWIDRDSPWTLNFVALIDNDTGKLDTLGFKWYITNESPFEFDLSPQKVLENLGPPDEIFAAVAQTSVHYRGQIILVMQYLEGISYSLEINVPIAPTANGFVVNYCLDEMTLQDDLNNYVIGKVFIMEPIPEPLTRRTPLQWWIYGYAIRDWEMRPVEEVFGVTPTEIAEMAANQENVCLSASIIFD